MFKRDLIAAAVALAFAGAAQGQDAELAKIREEIKQMKDGYEQRIQSLTVVVEVLLKQRQNAPIPGKV